MFLVATIILGVTYAGIAFAQVPRLKLDRPTVAFSGAVFMVLLGVLSYQEAIAAIDFNTIALLLGMMVIVSALQAAGFFHLLALKSLALATSRTRMLILVIVATGVCSAIFVNDAVVLLFTPVIVAACRARGENPVPFLVAEAMSSNIGSTATIVGNPQNMLIGITSGISFGRFFLYLLPVAVLSTLVLILVTRRISLNAAAPSIPVPDREGDGEDSYDAGAIIRLLPVLAVVILGFFVGPMLKIGIPMVALFGAVAALALGKARPDSVMRRVNWLLLLFFVGLFVVIAGAHKAGVLDAMVNRIVVEPSLAGIASVHAVSAVVSQLVSNVPLTMLVMPLFENVPGDTMWIALAAGSTLAGNLTIIGAVANIIVVEGAAREGVRISFGQFMKLGVPVTLATLLISVAVLGLEIHLGWLR